MKERKKTKKQTQRRGVSAGTLAMLLLTMGVLISSVLFLTMIAGETLKSRAQDAAQMAQRAGLQLMSEAEGLLLRQEERRQAESLSRRDAQKRVSETSEPETQPPVTITIAAAGTVHAPKAITSGAERQGKEYKFDAVLSGLGDVLSKADLAIATLETATAGEKKGYGSYNAPATLLDALRASGVDVLSLGTEHALDMGYEGLEMTIAEVTARGMAHTGAALDGARENSAVGSIGGVQVAVLGYTYGLSDEGKAAASEQEQEAIARLNMQRMEEDIRQARAEGANVVIVTAHWGTKNKQETPDELRRMAKALAEAGADVILGAHPNVVQGAERLSVTRADGLEYEAVVCYSLGSLLTDARTEENTAGMIVHLPITYDPNTRRISLGSYACSPVYTARQTEDGKSVYRVVDVENAQALATLSEAEQEAAQRAAALVREITGQSKWEGEGEG